MPRAIDELFPEVYDHVRKLAARHLRDERPDHTLQPTALANEAYLRLARDKKVSYQNRSQVLALAGRAIFQILVEHGRSRAAIKRGANPIRVTLVTQADSALPFTDVLALTRALDRLREATENGPRQVQLLELIYFSGLTGKEAADELGVSRATATRDWKFAHPFLQDELCGNETGAE